MYFLALSYINVRYFVALFSELNTKRSLESASLHQTPTAVAAAAAASIGSMYPRHPAGVQFKFASHLMSPAAAATPPSSSVTDLRRPGSQLLIDVRSAFSCVLPTSRDRQPEVGSGDVTRPTTTVKPRIWCIADVATAPDNGPPARPPARARTPVSPGLPDTCFSSASVGVKSV